MRRRRFTQDFKRSAVEQLLSETVGPAELCRRHDIASGQLYTWKKQYVDAKLDPKTSREAEKKQISLPKTAPSSKALKGGAS